MPSMAVIMYEKERGETLRDMLVRFRKEYPEYQENKITYAGRLDPLASGLIVMLTDDDVHRKDLWNKRDKVYEVSFFFAAETDSYDVLGRIHNTSLHLPSHEEVVATVENMNGIQQQAYPPFSSKTVQGKPLWLWAREEKLSEITIPRHEVRIYSGEYLGHKSVATETLFSEIQTHIEKVSGDFRQQEILADWHTFFEGQGNREYIIYTARFQVSSGTYIRSLVQEIGRHLNSTATVLHIRRTHFVDNS